jgi:hypothetical protein
MGDGLQVHVVEAQHDLVNDVHGLALSETGHLSQTFEQLSAFHQL